MTTAGWQLAQLNLARPVAPLDSIELADFVALLAPINALADSAPGFVWRLQTPAGDATGIQGFGDESLIVNLSVWTSIDTLGTFVFRGEHVEVMRRRREWFARMGQAFTVLWWVPAGDIPTVDEAEARLTLLRRLGPTVDAFTFRNPFPAPDENVSATPAGEGWLCPA